MAGIARTVVGVRVALIAALIMTANGAPPAAAQRLDRPGTQGVPRTAPPSGGRPAIAAPAITAPAAVPAAAPVSATVSGPMEITVVRGDDPACAPACPEWIAAQGTIDARSPVRLKRALSRIGKRRLPILIDSPGGTVDDALALARIIRERRLDVIVARTDVITCRPGDAACANLARRGIRLGRPSAEAARCASSCPFVMAGGVRRVIVRGALVGLHQAATYRVMTRVLRTYRVVPRYEWGVPVGTRRQLVAERQVAQTVTPAPTSPQTYTKIARSFRAMGVSPAIMPLILATPNDSMLWLSEVQALRLDLATEVVMAPPLEARDEAGPPPPTAAADAATAKPLPSRRRAAP